MKRKVVGGNALLNKPGFHSIGAISYNIERSPASEGGLRSYLIASVCISDCDRKVMLDFDIDDNSPKRRREEYENSLYKIDVLISELQAFRRDYEEIVHPELFKPRKKKK